MSDSNYGKDPFSQSPSKGDIFIYDPCDARIECFGIDLAIKNRDY